MNDMLKAMLAVYNTQDCHHQSPLNCYSGHPQCRQCVIGANRRTRPILGAPFSTCKILVLEETGQAQNIGQVYILDCPKKKVTS